MATDATLTKIEMNVVLEQIQKFRFDPAEFSWTELKTQEYGYMSHDTFNSSQLIHRATRYYFTFGGNEVRFCPGSAKKVDSVRHDNKWTIKGQQLVEWLDRLREEVDAPDLWAAVGSERILSDAAARDDNRPFTASEQSEIVNALGELKEVRFN